MYIAIHVLLTSDKMTELKPEISLAIIIIISKLTGLIVGCGFGSNGIMMTKFHNEILQALLLGLRIKASYSM